MVDVQLEWVAARFMTGAHLTHILQTSILLHGGLKKELRSV